jgi:hypothetical protein
MWLGGEVLGGRSVRGGPLCIESDSSAADLFVGLGLLMANYERKNRGSEDHI